MSILTVRRQGFLIALLLVIAALVWASPSQAATPTDLFISEYIEGSSNNKAIEIYNDTGAAIDLAAGGYSLQYFFNGSSSAGLTINLTGVVAASDVHVVAHSSAAADILAQADQTNGSGWFNGDDAVVLRKGTTIVDSIGQVGFDPGSEWGSGLVSTADNTLRRKFGYCGDPDATNLFDPAVEWDGFATNTYDNLGTPNGCGYGAPTVLTIAPNTGAVNQPTDTAIAITFSEPVNVTGDWYQIACSDTGNVTAQFQATTSDDTTYTLTLVTGALLPAGEKCTVHLPAGHVSAQDDGLPIGEFSSSFFTSALASCPTDGATLISAIQGEGSLSPLSGQVVVVEGIVTGDFQDGVGTNGDLNGFYVQEEESQSDGNALTSEGLFVFQGSSPVIDVQIGDLVRVKGTAAEFGGSGATSTMTQLSIVTRLLICGTAALPSPTDVTLPVAAVSDFERYEGMLVRLPQMLEISEYFNFDRFNEIVLALPLPGEQRLHQPTAIAEPGSSAATDRADYNVRSRITLDDGRTTQNPNPLIHPNGNIFDLSNTFRGGDLVENATGILDDSFGRYRIHPTQGANYTAVNLRPIEPDSVGGSLTVASFNVLNYFTTLDYPSGNPLDNKCGPLQNQECRGADSDQPSEFNRQRTKIIAALAAIDADVVGLIEIENHPDDVPTADLVGGLNDAMGAGTYAYIQTGAIGTDAIRVALIYKPGTVTLVGEHAILDSSVDSRFLDDKNRPVLAQTFQDKATGGSFTVAVNHLKSKGSSCDDVGDPDLGDGAGNCNLTRKAAAAALVDWLATDPTGSGDSDFLIVGDLNAYDKEAPITAVRAGEDDTLGTNDDYTDLVLQYLGDFAYSYVFDGQLGYLDHALANQALLSAVTGATIWHINADEPDILDYDTSFKQDAQDALYEPNAYRSSDHDPVMVGLTVCADETAPTLEVAVSPDTLWPPDHKLVTVNATVSVVDDFDPTPVVALLSVTSSEPDNGTGDGDTEGDIVIVDNTTIDLRAERAGSGSGRVYTLTYEAADRCGNASQATATVTVPANQGNGPAKDKPAKEAGEQAGTEAGGTVGADGAVDEPSNRIYLPSVVQ